ncbi:MAG: YdbL family protein [Rhodospirillales bacterium]|nr:YdbL family protein [Rhodospirillales bacterium]
MKKFYTLLSVLLLAFVFSGNLTTANAQSPLAEAKAAGYLGEQPNGYLGVVNSSAPETALVLAQEINIKRREKYISIARSNGSTLNAVEVVVGAKLISRTPPGQFYKDANGAWIRR